jgi:hypothetical protein
MKRRRDKGWIYIIGAHVGMDSLVKIGFTAGSAEKRMHTLQLGSPVELCVVTTFRGTRAQEQEMHRTFAEYRSHREWFRFEGGLLEFVRMLTECDAEEEVSRQ